MDATLHENGDPCPACELRREDRDPWDTTPVPCNTCRGSGRVSRGEVEVAARSVAWARKCYWPEREARWKLQNGTI